MSTRTVKSHLGERRFLEYPQIAADEWGLQPELTRGLLTPARLLGAALLAVAAVALLLLR